MVVPHTHPTPMAVVPHTHTYFVQRRSGLWSTWVYMGPPHPCDSPPPPPPTTNMASFLCGPAQKKDRGGIPVHIKMNKYGTKDTLQNDLVTQDPTGVWGIREQAKSQPDPTLLVEAN